MEQRPDYVQPGSARHASMLGLQKADKDAKFVYEGWTLQDPTQWGPQAREDYIQAQLIQRVGELMTKPKVPVNAPRLWEP